MVSLMFHVIDKEAKTIMDKNLICIDALSL